MPLGPGERPILLHPADYGPDSALAFAHAVRIALRSKHRLSLLHILKEGELEPRVSGLQQVADLLIRWNMLGPNAQPDKLESELDLRVDSLGVPAESVRTGILGYLDDHPCDLAVIATQAHKGLARWLEVSVSKRALRKANTMILLMREAGRGFVDMKTGALKLNKVLMPVDDKIDPLAALARADALIEQIGFGTEIQLLHVGTHAPTLAIPKGSAARRPLLLREGPIAPTILEVAHRISADLIAMPTAGRSGLLGAMRGSVTAKIIDDARWPVLSIPAA